MKVDSILNVISFSTLQGSTSIETQGSTQHPASLKKTAPSTVSSAAPSNNIDIICVDITVQYIYEAVGSRKSYIFWVDHPIPAIYIVFGATAASDIVMSPVLGQPTTNLF